MALDVFLQENPAPPIHGAHYEEILYFDDDNEAYYWFLYPLFLQLRKRTGKMIDLYDTAVFRGDGLQPLADTIASARQLTKNQPDDWEVVIGFEVGPARLRREIQKPVTKAEMLSLLDKLQAAVAKATEKNYYLALWGD